MTNTLRAVCLALFLAAVGPGQSINSGGSGGSGSGGFVYTGVLAGIPATCTVGQVAFITDATPGQNQYNCTATNTWTQNLNSGSGGASTALSNLSAVNVNTSLLAQTGVDLGSTTKPFRNLFLFGSSTFGTDYFEFTGNPSSTRTITVPDATDTLGLLAATQTFTNKTVDGVTPTTFGYLDATSSIQTQLNAKAASNAATTVNGQACTLGSTCTVPFQTNSSNNTSQAGINLVPSTTNSVGLTVTPTNSATNQEKFEVTGSSYTGNAATATNLASYPALCTGSQFSQGLSSGSNNCGTPSGSGGTGNAASTVSVSFSATPTYTCPSSTAGTVTDFLVAQLTGNITSSTLASCTSGQEINFVFQQPASGGPYTVVMPTGFDPAPLSQTASIYTTLTYLWDGTHGRLLNSTNDTQTLITMSERAAVGTPASSSALCWPDSTDHAGIECKANASSSVFKLTLAGADINPVTGIVSSINGKTITLSGNFTTTGAFNPTFAIPSSSTWTFPSGSDTLVTLTATQTLTNKTLTAPSLGAATATSLLATGIVDGQAPVTITTGSSATLGGTYKSGYTFNQEGTAATAVTYTLPTAAAGLQYCVANSYNGSAANTGTLEVLTSASGQFIIFTDGTLSATGGYVISAGAARDSACVVGVDATHWMLYPSSGTWAKH